jgi:PAS domain S-box-containing protein
MTENTPEIPKQAATSAETLCPRAAPTRGRKILPYVTLVILVALSLLVWRHFENQTEERNRRHFDEYAETMVVAIRKRLIECEMIMQGGAGLFSSSTEVTREQWRNFVTYRRVQGHLPGTQWRFPGIQVIGIARRVHHADLPRHLQKIRSEGISDYTISPPGEREEYSPIIFVEPFDVENEPAVGFDLLSEPLRRKTLELAGSTGSCVISEKIILHSDSKKLNVHGFLLCLPIYEAEKPLLTVEERRAALWGYVVAAFHIEDLIRGISLDAGHKIKLEIFDGPVASQSALMLDSQVSSNDCSNSMFTVSKILDLYGRQWTFLFRATKVFEAQAADRLPRTLLAVSIVISLLIFLFLKMLEGTGERALALARDLTRELEDERAWLGTVIDTAMDAIIALNKEGLILVWNSSAVRMFGYTAEEALGKDFHSILTPPQFYEAAMKGFRSFQKTGGPSILGLTHEIFALRKDGERVPVEITVSMRKNHERNGIVAVVRDITERKKVQAQIVAERKRFYQVLETLPAFVALIGQDHSLPYVNRQFRERFGDPAGRTCHETIFGKALQCSDCRTFEVFRTGSPEFWGWTGLDGRIYQIHDYPYTDSDGSPMVLELGLDITDQKQAEGERVARQAAESANRQKSLFLSNMSHEIRTPMNAILGFAQILERDPKLSSRQREQIGSINRSGQHLLSLINDILDMSKIEAGMNVLNPVAFCLQDLIDDLAMMFRSRAEAKNLQFFVERDANLPYCVMADAGKIRQILINLLGNAIKFTDAGGVSMRVMATSPANPPAEKAKTLQLRVEIEDSGPGISATELTNIFTPFAQGEAGVIAGGTGLGLPISRRLAEMMGGSITVETTVGRGSCFRFDMPLEPSDAAVKEKSPAPRLVTGLESGSGPFRILVVDDMQINRDLLCDLLQPLGFEIRQAENGAEALTIFEEWAPHAVLMDMRMPVMDGYEATRRIKATEKGRDTPVIAVTASAFKDSEDQILATGVSAYLRKPFRAEELYDTLGGCLGLRYVYADDSPVADKGVTPNQLPAINAERVAALPADILQAMRQAVDEGDMTRLAELIDQIEPQDDDVAQVLHALANRYDYVQLGHLLDMRGNKDA